MEKIRKLRGGNYLFVSEDGNTLVGYSGQNIAYVYDLSGNSLDPIYKIRTIQYLSRVAVSPDRKYLATKSTTGEIAVFSLESGEELFRVKTKEMDGYQMYFTGDSKSVLDLGRSRIKLIDIETQKVTYLDDDIQPVAGYCPRVWHIALDRSSRQIYRFIETESNYTGELQISPSDPGRISFQVAKEVPYQMPKVLKGFSLCRERNYYWRKPHIIVTDKQFNEIGKIDLPSEFEHFPPMRKFFISPCEKYILFDFMKVSGESYLYELATMKMVRKFEYPYLWDFTMVKDDTMFVVSTWQGAFIGKV
ncbi:MAG: WD40 repeat domain-containing protein [Clostridiales bacterium]|nr:WD40 repeat domain-containing protein [Clostridiales bacterium]